MPTCVSTTVRGAQIGEIRRPGVFADDSALCLDLPNKQGAVPFSFLNAISTKRIVALVPIALHARLCL